MTLNLILSNISLFNLLNFQVICLFLHFSVAFGPGLTRAEFSLRILPDNFPEIDETFRVNN